jgi:polar amino acid transport system substrate-binding protein
LGRLIFGFSLFPLALLCAAPALARPLEQIKESSLAVCANPNALPFAEKGGTLHGFQIEMAEALAKTMGVELDVHWVITSIDRGRADCDMIVDAIADPQVLDDAHLKASKPYRRSGVALAVRTDNAKITSLADIRDDMKVGVLPGSLAAKVLIQRDIHTYPAMLENDLLDAVASGEIAAAAVTPTAIGYYNLTHPGRSIKLVDAFAGIDDLDWNIAIGLVQPDAALTRAVNTALDKLLAAGTVKAIYARYGVTLIPPRQGH